MSTLLDIRNLALGIRVGRTDREILSNICLRISAGQALGLVGESGSGKSMTARSILRLLPSGTKITGQIHFNGRSVLDMDDSQLRTYRARGVAMIFQDPRAHIDPVRRIGDYLTEGLRFNFGLSQESALRRVSSLLRAVRISDVDRIVKQYPHQLSGGMLQRVMLAGALASNPELLLADEPTTALDVTTQAEVMSILRQQRMERGLAMLFITHDLELAAATCDETAVMYAGGIVEQQESARLLVDPLHPYTARLAQSRPSVTTRAMPDPIPGRPISAFEAPAGCAFAPRCSHYEPDCAKVRPPVRPFGRGLVACRRAEELRNGVLRRRQAEP